VPSSTDDLESLATLLARDPEALLVATLEGRVVGTLIAGFDGWRGTMHRLVVAPEARRRGIAGALVRAGEERLRGLGAKRIVLAVAKTSDAANGFWQASGYEPDTRVTRYVAML
jgi:ribosomal protein S18 acetylase RimI-like enzyme